MNAFIKEIADREELLTVDDLRVFIEKHAKTLEVEGKLKYDDQKRVEDALKHLKGKNLADAETVENVLREFGLNPDMLADSIAGASKALQKIDKKLSMKVGDHFRLENGNPAVVNQNDIAEWTEEREEAQAAYDVFKEVSAALNNGAIREFFYKLEGGEVPPDEARLIKSAFQSADLKTITDSMLTLDTKMSARKGELRSKREQGEEEARRSALYRKWLAIGLGTPAALAILIALVSRPKSPGGGFGH